MAMKIALCFAILATTSALALASNDWESFKSKYGKSYLLHEEAKRQQNFINNLQKIESHNKLFEQGKLSYALGINEFADLSEDEFRSQRLGFKPLKEYNDDVEISSFNVPSDAVIPDTVDWRDSGAVTDIKDQSICGSCWAFSATGALEAQLFFKTGNLVSLSEQNLVDCSTEYGNSGCQGGDMIGAFLYVHNNDGLASESAYPYHILQQKCKYDTSFNVTSATRDVVQIRIGNEEDLKAAVATYGPVSVAIDADHVSFQLYSHGVYHELRCKSAENQLDHGVLVVGYGTENGEDYWLVKNSWGKNWGETGYIKMSRNRDNNCGIVTYAVLPILYQ